MCASNRAQRLYRRIYRSSGPMMLAWDTATSDTPPDLESEPASSQTTSERALYRNLYRFHPQKIPDWALVVEAWPDLPAAIKTPYPMQHALGEKLTNISASEREQIARGMERLVRIIGADKLDAGPMLEVRSVAGRIK